MENLHLNYLKKLKKVKSYLVVVKYLLIKIIINARIVALIISNHKIIK